MAQNAIFVRAAFVFSAIVALLPFRHVDFTLFRFVTVHIFTLLYFIYLCLRAALFAQPNARARIFYAKNYANGRTKSQRRKVILSKSVRAAIRRGHTAFFCLPYTRALSKRRYACFFVRLIVLLARERSIVFADDASRTGRHRAAERFV